MTRMQPSLELLEGSITPITPAFDLARPALVPNALLAVDVVLFTARQGPLAEALRVLLVRQKDPTGKDSWMVPGVLLGETETFEEAAKRSLAERAGINAATWYLEQLA